jgi:mono/diheme cytochrome c family protein
MKRHLLRLGLGLVMLMTLAGMGLTGVTYARWDRTFDAPYPGIEASSDPDIVELGRYLVFGPMHCAYCHTPKEQWPRLVAGETLPMIGGYSFTIPPGTFHTPNITPDDETGIGRRTDAELARTIRHQVRPDGRAALPFMEFQNISDADLRAIISYLRSQEPVRHAVPDHQLTFLGKAVLATVIKPQGPAGTPPAESPPIAPTIERGEYLANRAAQCFGCHTNRSMMDGKYIGPRFAGGLVMDSDEDSSIQFVSPNLTPDPATGAVSGWTEDQFVTRFRSGTLLKGSPMPWTAFGRMHDDDLRALYRYLHSLEPVVNDVGVTMRAKGSS